MFRWLRGGVREKDLDTEAPRSERSLPSFSVLEHESDLEEVFSLSRVLLYKHSTRCGTSSFALREVRNFAAEGGDVPIYLVDVHAGRAVSNAIEERTGIPHESPQVLLMEEGVVRWSGSHSEVTRRTLDAVLSEYEPTAP